LVSLDRVPLYACIVIAIGLLWHFLAKLYGYKMAEARRVKRLDSSASEATSNEGSTDAAS